MSWISVDVKKRMLTASGWKVLAVSWQGEAGQLTAVFGPSGSGKTTLLRLIAGLSVPESGKIHVGDEVWFDSGKKINLPPQKRSVGFVFQEYSLFPNMTVRENIAYACSSGIRSDKIESLLSLAEMATLSGAYPAELSGGQKQRVALVRALARQPKLLLLDEPLSALDGQMRLNLQEHILRVHRQTSVTTLMVSHDISEVFRLADNTMVLKEGRIERMGRPSEVFGAYSVSGKFKFVAEVVEVAVDGFLSVLSLRVGNDIVKVVDADPDHQPLRAGDRVVVASKAFNPVIIKCDP